MTLTENIDEIIFISCRVTGIFTLPVNYAAL